MKRVYYKQGEINYKIGLGFGCWAESVEDRTLCIGDTRVIGNLLMQVSSIDFHFYSRTYRWVPANKKINNMEKLNEWEKQL
jgi:hypothetical protein